MEFRFIFYSATGVLNVMECHTELFRAYFNHMYVTYGGWFILKSENKHISEFGAAYVNLANYAKYLESIFGETKLIFKVNTINKNILKNSKDFLTKSMMFSLKCGQFLRGKALEEKLHLSKFGFFLNFAISNLLFILQKKIER